jgi:hypothetical protein
MARRLGRFVACWGNGQHGRLGHATREASEAFPRVVAALADHRAARVACGGAHTAAVMGGCGAPPGGHAQQPLTAEGAAQSDGTAPATLAAAPVRRLNGAHPKPRPRPRKRTAASGAGASTATGRSATAAI